MDADLETTLKLLEELCIQVREDIPDCQGTRHLWDAVEDAEHWLEDNRQLKLDLPTAAEANMILNSTKVGADFNKAFDLLTKED